MFEHSIKVPRQYKIVANIFKKVSTEGGSVKTLLYDNKLRHFRTDVLYALITETIKHAPELDKIFKECSLLTKEPRLDPWLAKVLATELLYGKKALPGKSKPEQTILSYKDQFEKYTTETQDSPRPEDIPRPRYVRINTNLLTTSDAIGAFQDEGYKFIRCTSSSYDDYLKQIQGLMEYDFTQDYHVKTVFVFAPGTKLHYHDLYLENKIILQDKATAMAVHLLAPPPGSVVLDMCAAPGNKTTQLAAFMRNQGKIYAVERNEQRYKTLCDFVEKTGSTCVTTLHGDSLELKRGDYDDVEYILLDPSCSGSGMTLSVHNYIDENRLAKLTSLQEKFLKHAMNAFPNAKKIVYSTCSVFPEENERVITNVVMLSRSRWRVQDVKELLKGQWNNIGSGMYGSIGARCMYARPDSDLTTGFFLAVLERDKKDLEKSQNSDKDAISEENGDIVNNGVEGESKKSNKKQKKRKSEANIGNSVNDEIDEVVNNGCEDTAKGNKKQKKRKSESEAYIDKTDIVEENDEQCGKKKNKHKKKDASENGNVDDELKTDVAVPNTEDQYNEEVIERKKKKKHKNKNKSVDEATEVKDASILEDAVSYENKKKKKRKKNASENYQPDEIGNNSLENHDAIQDNELCLVERNEVPKKKKKKDKVKEVHEQVENNLNDSQNKVKSTLKKKSKKTKNINDVSN